MTSKDAELSVWCPQCKTDGLLTIPEAMLDEPHYVLCPACGGETAQVWCATCGMGGQLFDNVAERPDAWRCGECKSEYPLPADFYDKPVEFEIFKSRKKTNYSFSEFQSLYTSLLNKYAKLALYISLTFSLLAAIVNLIYGIKVGFVFSIVLLALSGFGLLLIFMVVVTLLIPFIYLFQKLREASADAS
ncbi:MAG: hypothetical protein OEZ02_15395 [Anaerolineae bacterium]|nr:hypothetical protein [Anaerolineae bacterium]